MAKNTKNIWEKSFGAAGGYSYRPSDELYHAMKRGNEKQFLKLLDEIDVDKEKNSLLRLAVERGNETIVSRLLNAKADPNIALYTAAEYQNEKIVSMLLQAGANPNIGQAYTGRTILMAQVNGNIRFNPKITQLLINAKANLDEALETAMGCRYLKGNNTKCIPEYIYSMMSMLLGHVTTIRYPSSFFERIQGFDQRDPHILNILNLFCTRLKNDPNIENKESETYKVFSKANTYSEKLQRLTDICEAKSTPLQSFIGDSFISKIMSFFTDNDGLTPEKVDALLKRYSTSPTTTAVELKKKLLSL